MRRRGAELYRDFQTSLKVQTRLFFEHSTLHGVRYIADKSRPYTERFMWLVCVCTGAVATAVIIVNLWEKFQTNPTITGLDTDFHNWKVPFPAITVCQEKPYNLTHIEEYIEKYPDYSIKLLEFLAQLSFDSLRHFEKYSFGSVEVPNLKHVALELMNKCEDIFTQCEYKGVKINCCEHFYPVFTERGFCYTFNSRHSEKTDSLDFEPFYIKETDLKWSLKFVVRDTSMNMPIYILSSDEQAGLDVDPQYTWDYRVDKISFSVKQTYTTEDTRQLSIKQRHCIFSDELKLNIDKIYTYTACARQCRMDNSMRFCTCVPHFYPKTGFYKHCSFKQLKCLARYLKQIVDIDGCSCELGCFNTVYEVEKLSEVTEDESNEIETQFVSWPIVRYKREVLFGWVDLLVSFGGIAGLFLGFSLLSGVEILYYFTIRACCMIVEEEEEIRKIQRRDTLKQSQKGFYSNKKMFKNTSLAGNFKGVGSNKIKPINGRNLKRITVLPPFGIEFVN